MQRDPVEVAATMVRGGRGILAADESIGTMDSRLEKAGVEPGEDRRRAYREMLVTTPDLHSWISGVILSDDIARATTHAGPSFLDACREARILPGVKVDTGAKPLPFTDGESVTEGLDGLRGRLEDYARMGLAFTKWRAVIRIDDRHPSGRALRANAHALARYAALVQEAGLVPIVEPEVLMDGDHDIDRCEEVTTTALHTVFAELADQGVTFEAMVLKPNMVIAGARCPRQADVETVAAATVRTLRRTVPAAVPGIAFLSGGQGPERATDHLRAMCRLGPHPWELSFSFGRALVDPALTAWSGSDARVRAGQEALAERARANAEARSAGVPVGAA